MTQNKYPCKYTWRVTKTILKYVASCEFLYSFMIDLMWIDTLERYFVLLQWWQVQKQEKGMFLYKLKKLFAIELNHHHHILTSS